MFTFVNMLQFWVGKINNYCKKLNTAPLIAALVCIKTKREAANDPNV